MAYVCAGGGCRENVQRDMRYCAAHQKASEAEIEKSGFTFGEERICFNCDEPIRLWHFATWVHEDGERRCNIFAIPSNLILPVES